MSRLSTWIAAAVAVVLLIVVLAVRNRPLSAAEFLERSEKPGPRLAAGQAAVERVRIVRGDRTLERDIVKGASRPEISGIDWEADLVSTPVAWVDPLSAVRFARWHKQNKGRTKDVVFEVDGLATLVAEPEAAGSVRRASLTVRKSDWHVVSERVEFEEGPELQVTELQYEVRTGAPVTEPAIAETSSELPGMVRVDPQSATAARAAIPARVGSLDRMELRAPAMEPVRREPMMGVGGLPPVAADTSLAGTPPVPAPAAAPTPLYATEPPLAQALADKLGGPEPAGHYMEEVGELYRRAVVAATALDQLAKQYPAGAWNGMPQELQDRVGKMAMDSVGLIGESAASFSSDVATVLDPMVAQRGVSTPPIGGGGECVVWQTSAARILEDLRGMQTSFRRLFVVDHTTAPIVLSADELLRDAAGRKARLSQDVAEVCRVGSAR